MCVGGLTQGWYDRFKTVTPHQSSLWHLRIPRSREKPFLRNLSSVLGYHAWVSEKWNCLVSLMHGIEVKSRYLEICESISQSCPNLCNPMDCSLPGSSVHGISQARILEWGCHPSPGDLPDPEIESGSPALQADSLPFEPPEKKPCKQVKWII